MKNTAKYKHPILVKMILSIFLLAFGYVLVAIIFGIFSVIYTLINFVIRK